MGLRGCGQAGCFEEAEKEIGHVTTGKFMTEMETTLTSKKCGMEELAFRVGTIG
jgi:hypothetical protein